MGRHDITTEEYTAMKTTLNLLFALTVAISTSNAQDGNSGDLSGTWLTQVTLRVCQTGAVIREFPATNSFHVGGTMTDATAGSSAAQRTAGLGKWEKVTGHTYTATTFAFLFSPAGVWTGIQKLSHQIEVKGEEIEFTSTTEIFDGAGTVVLSGCATAVGRKL
jgi:hypothetical protein